MRDNAKPSLLVELADELDALDLRFSQALAHSVFTKFWCVQHQGEDTDVLEVHGRVSQDVLKR
jgi:hypothetical protein